MQRYQHLVGKRVEVHYRAGEYYLSTAGILASDSGKAIFVQESFAVDGKQKVLRVEIPYPYVIRVDEPRSQGIHPNAVPELK
jgi:hypothetical protein